MKTMMGAAAVASLIALAQPADAASRDGCRRQGVATHCTFVRQLALGEQILIRQIGGAAAAPRFTVTAAYGIDGLSCVANMLLDDDGDGLPDFGGDFGLVSVAPGRAVQLSSASWVILAQSAEVFELVRGGGVLDELAATCWVGLEFRYVRDLKLLFPRLRPPAS